MKGAHRFQRTSLNIEGQPRTGMVIACSKCTRREILPDNRHGGLAVSKVAEKFRQKGWSVASRPSGDLCPRCKAKHAPARPQSPAQKRAAYCRIAGIPRKQETTPMTEAALKTVTAAPPREPSMTDRRRVLEALDEHYDVPKGCYTGSFSDQALAAKLGVPRAWVSDIREKLFGPDVNEAAAQRNVLLVELDAKLRALEADALLIATRAEGLRLEVTKALK